MKIIISPAKKMREDRDNFPITGLPVFLPQTEELLHCLQKMSYDELKKLWGCSDKLTALNMERLRDMDVRAAQTPAILAYEGIQYQYMAPGVFSDKALAYIQQHLRILSGFYGVVKPFDGVCPYRLEMQAKLNICNVKELYSYWGSKIADEVCRNEDTVINLASLEYSLCLSRHLPENVRMITCVFAERKGDKLIEKGTMCKMARGEMVRFMAENRVESPAQLKSFDRLDYRFSAEHSDENTFVYLKEEV